MYKKKKISEPRI